MSKTESPMRLAPPIIFPLGIGLGTSAEDGIVFIEFFASNDTESKGGAIVGRYAVPLTKAENLARELTKCIEAIKKPDSGD